MPNFDPTNNYSGVSNYGSEPYGYGQGYGDSYGSNNPTLQAYEAQLLQYINQVKSALTTLQSGTALYNTYSQYLNTAYQYLQQVDPQMMMGDPSMGGSNWGENFGANGVEQPGPQFPIAWQDQTRIVTDEGSEFYEVGRNDPESRTIEAYQQDGTIVVGSNSATTRVSEATDSRGKKMKVVEITYEDGKTRTVNFYGENLTIKSANPDNVIQDASVTAGVTIEGLDEESFIPEASIPGEKQADGSLLYDTPSIDFAPKGSGRAGQNQVHDVYGDLNLQVPNTSSAEVQPNVVYDSATQIEKRDGYKIIITHRDGSKDTFIVHKGFKINLNSREDSTKWMGTYEDGYQIRLTDPIEYSEEAFPGISFNNAASTGDDSFLNPDHPEDTQPDRTSGDKAYYNTSTDVEINANYNDTVKEHHITAPGQVTIHKSNYSDTVNWTKTDNGDGTFTYNITVTGEDGKEETYIIDSAMKIILDFLPAKITGMDPHDEVIQKGSVDSGTATPASAKVEALATITGKTAAEIQQAIPEGLDIDNSSQPNPEILAFLENIDPKLKTLLDQYRAGNNGEFTTAQIRNRVVELLNALYPTAMVAPATAEGNNKKSDRIVFGGEFEFSVINKDTGSLQFESVADEVAVQSANWPTFQQVSGYYNDDMQSVEDSKKLYNKIDLAMRTGDWNDVKGFLSNEAVVGGGKGNDLIRNLVNVLNLFSGGAPNIVWLLKSIPTDVRYSMINLLEKDGEERDNAGGVINTEGSAALIYQSLDS